MGVGLSKVEAVAEPAMPVPPPPPSPPGACAQPPPEGPPPVPEKFKNCPGYYDEMNRKAKDIFAIPFEGAKLIVNKALNSGFQVSHTIALATITPSGYRFGTTYVSALMTTPADPAAILLADSDTAGNMNAQAILQPYDFLRLKWAAQIMRSTYVSNTVSADFRGSDYSGTVSLVNPDIKNESGILVLQYLQAITERFCIGTEFLCQRSMMQVPGGAMTMLSCSARYQGATSTWSGHLGSNGGGLLYYRKLTDEIQVGVEVENNVQHQQFIATAGYCYELPKANFTMKATIDTNWTVTGLFEKRLLPMPFMFSLCGCLNHVKNQFRLGVGLTVG